MSLMAQIKQDQLRARKAREIEKATLLTTLIGRHPLLVRMMEIARPLMRKLFVLSRSSSKDFKRSDMRLTAQNSMGVVVKMKFESVILKLGFSNHTSPRC